MLWCDTWDIGPWDREHSKWKKTEDAYRDAWFFSEVRLCRAWWCQEPGFCSTLICIYSIRACWLKGVGGHWFLFLRMLAQTSRGRAGWPPTQIIWKSLLWAIQAHCDKYKVSGGGMQWLPPLVHDSKDLCVPEMKQSSRIHVVKKSVLFKRNLPSTYWSSLGSSKP